MFASADRPVRAHPKFFDALPPYLGGKRRLCPLIFALVAEQIPRHNWSQHSWLDPFSGGGAVSLSAKAHGFSVTASDLAERAVLVSRALVENSDVRLRRSDILGLFRDDGVERAATQVPNVLSVDQARWIDGALTAAAERPEPVRSLLRLVIMKATLRLFPMSLPTATDARAAAEGDFDRISPRRVGHYLRASKSLRPEAIWRIAEQVNAGVFGGRGTALQGDARELVVRQPADVLYLDPPYAGTSRYETEYALVDELFGDTGPPEHPPPTLDELLEAAAAIPLLVLSYGGPTLSLTELEALVARHRPVVRALAVPYPHLRSIASDRKNRQNREYLIIASR